MEVIRTIEMTKEERNTLDKVLNDFNKSSLPSKYISFGLAIKEMMFSGKYQTEDFKIDYDDMNIIHRAVNWYWIIPDENLGHNVAEFIDNLVNNNFEGYEIKIIL